ncbi:MAG TPA: vWA domain-containing protein, partial [Parafilimonas sp.]
MKKSDPLAKMVIIKMILKAGIKRYTLCFSALIILFFCAQNSYGQITITTTPADISSAIAGNGFDAIISATAHSGNPVTLSVSSDIDAGSHLHFADLNPPAGTNLHLQAIGAGDPLAGSWSFSIIATATGESPVGEDFTINVRKPIDLMFVLDKSGSMTTTITGGTISRWVALKNGVAQFLTNYQSKLTTSNSASGDQMGIRMFSDADAAPVNAPFNVNNFIPVTPSTNLNAILDGDNPGGNTAMGTGLLAGRNFL